MNDYYVYVYIDPRNFEEFYYGKGKDSRKDAHLQDSGDSDKARRIQAIHKAGQAPIVRVIASRLSENEALLVEKTLLWKLGKVLTNIAPGHYASNFRPYDTLHVELPGFDFQNGIFYYNVGEGRHRSWNDYRKYGFISGGQGARWRDAMLGFKRGDVVAAYLKGRGFVGIGVVSAAALPVSEYRVNGRPILDQDLCCKEMAENASDLELCEYLAEVKWVSCLDRESAKWESRSGLYTTTHIRASLDGQPGTVSYLEQEFGVDMRSLLKARVGIN
jgi:hypothetical protein